jgi:hypothetical protein
MHMRMRAHAHRTCLQPWLSELERAVADGASRRLDLDEQAHDVDTTMLRGEGRKPPGGFLELARRRDRSAAARLVPGHRHMHEPLVEVPLGGVRRAPDELELLVGLEVLAVPDERETVLQTLHALRNTASERYPAAVATVLLCGVDLFFRGKLDALLTEHRLITVEHTESPDLVIVDISRVDAEEVAETYPDVPILGYTNHTDTAGLRAAHAAGFDQVVVKSALVERCRELVAELAPSA